VSLTVTAYFFYGSIFIGDFDELMQKDISELPQDPDCELGFFGNPGDYCGCFVALKRSLTTVYGDFKPIDSNTMKLPDNADACICRFCKVLGLTPHHIEWNITIGPIG